MVLVSAIAATALFLTTLPGEDLYLAGYDAERAGKYGAAIDAYSACAKANGFLSPYARVREARCRAAAGDTDSAIAIYRQLLESEPGPWVAMARAYLASLLAAREQYPQAAALYRDVLKLEPPPWWMDRYREKAAEVYLKVPDMLPEAFNYYRNICITTRYRDARINAIQKLAASEDPEDQVLIFLGFIRSAAVKEAAKVIQRLLPYFEHKGVPTDTVQAVLNADYGKMTPAECDQFQPILRIADKNRYARILAVHIARALLAADNLDAATALMDALAKQCPGKEEVGDALWWLASALDDANRDTAAFRAWLKLADTVPAHFRADDALITVARAYHEKKQTEHLIPVLKKLAKEQPDSIYASNAVYWLGAAYKTAGKTKEAVEAFNQTIDLGGLGDFYAHCAQQQLALMKRLPAGAGKRFEGPLAFLRLFPPNGHTPPAIPEEVLNEPRCRRLAFFGEHGFEEAEWEAVSFMNDLKSGDRAAIYYRVLAENGVAATAIRLAQTWKWQIKDGKRLPDRLLLEYPRAYWPSVDNIAQLRKIDPYLILAVARQESTFRPDLKSWAGACGLMQVMPKTAEWLARKDPDAQKAMQNLTHPRNSILLGSKYLRDMLARSNGNLVFALASYNAGPGNCDKWRVKYPNVSMEEFIERIPFTETRWYVKAVLGNYAAYKSLYAP